MTTAPTDSAITETADAVGIRSSALFGSLPPVLDVCCGPKGMWFDKQDPRALFMDRRRETHVDTYPCGTKTNVIDPCVVGDFSKMDFPDESFRLVVFDPPHIEQSGVSQITKKYGSLQGEWREMLRAGFAECLRVLKPEGVLIFKWNECRFPVKDILALTDAKPLFGHKSGKKMQTHWIAFLKPNNEVSDRAGDGDRGFTVPPHGLRLRDQEGLSQSGLRVAGTRETTGDAFMILQNASGEPRPLEKL